MIVLSAWAACASVAAELPEVTEEALAELGTTLGVPQMGGFVFIEGRYLAPPYTVTRKGNGIFVNRIQIEQSSWARFAAPGAAAVPVKKAIDADGDFQEVTPAAADEPVAAVEPAKPKTVKSIDDLFDDDAPAAPAAAPVAVAAAQAAAPAPAALPPTELTGDDVKRQKELLVANLERLRKGYEQAFARNEFFFFGQRHSRVNGNYGTARTLIEVLPKALRYAQSPQDLMQRLNEGGVYFLDLGICSALFKNRGTFPLLEERLAKIVEAEELEALRRKAATNW
jgi:hypothetical protein